MDILENKVRFVLAVVQETIHIRNIKRSVLVLELMKQGFKQMKDMKRVNSTLQTINTTTS